MVGAIGNISKARSLASVSGGLEGTDKVGYFCDLMTQLYWGREEGKKGRREAGRPVGVSMGVEDLELLRVSSGCSGG